MNESVQVHQLYIDSEKADEQAQSREISSTKTKKFKILGYSLEEIKWINVIFLLSLYILAIYGFVHVLLTEIKFFTAVFVICLSLFAGLGLSVGKY
jgi:hypothetical protein